MSNNTYDPNGDLFEFIDDFNLGMPVAGSPGGTAGSGSGSVTFTGSQNSGSVGGGVGGAGGHFSGAGSAPFQMPLPLSLSLSQLATPKPTVKEDIRYVVVMNDGHCLELDEQTNLTPREIIGVAKFLAAVQASAQVQHAGANITVYWSHLINVLGIQRHFRGGVSDYTLYDRDINTLNIYLFDPKP